MKTTILADGTLSITPESDLEAYALNQWGQVNLDLSKIPANGQPLPNMILDCSEYAGRLGIFVKVNNLPTSGNTQ
ncbi:hypothetical protein [Burkholderia gladioli]|uniref:hypothetical protein n=1 Tax=Burkholderia gladioli TaxID=28095 RepID=UPI0016408577|nr:hypothetical protein [Burkholderia gladioli]